MQHRHQLRHFGHLDLLGQIDADRAADDHGDDDPANVAGIRPQNGGDQRDRHAGDAEQVALLRRFMARQARRLKINKIAATMYAAVTNPPDICYPLVLAKHLQHALSDGEPTENIDAGDQHGDKGEETHPATMADLQQRTDHDNS